MHDELRDRLRAAFRWTDPGPETEYLVSDRSGWWRDPLILADLGDGLADLFRADEPTVVVSPEVTGFLLGPLVARALGVGFVEAYRAGARRPVAEPMRWAEVPSDHRGEKQFLGVRDGLVTPADRVLLVDDWAATGSQARALSTLFPAYVGTAVILNETPPEVARELVVRGLLTGEDLTPPECP